MLKRTPFHEFHVSAGAKMVEFAGWEMPLYYGGIIEEHQQTRRSGGMFDVSHMGRLSFTGADTMRFLQMVLTRNLADMTVGQCRYSLVCNDAGGVLDDVIVARDTKRWVVICNASNREKLVRHFIAVRRKNELDFDMADETESTAMVALQGPKVIERLARSLPIDFAALKRYHFQTISVMLIKLTIYRTGYTGEDGVEVVLPARMGGMAMKMLGGKLDKPDATLRPAGLGARDTLRIEAGMPLYGHELSEEMDPISAGLGWAVDLSKEFIGVAPLRAIHEKGPDKKLVGLELEGRRIARAGAVIQQDGRPVGHVTSGTLAPTLGKSIAMGYVETGCAAVGGSLAVVLKDAPVAAHVVALPFYHRPA